MVKKYAFAPVNMDFVELAVPGGRVPALAG
jgi:hypothetical protein